MQARYFFFVSFGLFKQSLVFNFVASFKYLMKLTFLADKKGHCGKKFGDRKSRAATGRGLAKKLVSFDYSSKFILVICPFLEFR